MNIETLLKDIQNSKDLKPADFLPFICRESKEERYHVNLKLAEAFSEKGDLSQAKIFINRAWIFSDFSPSVLPLYLKIHIALEDFDSIRKAYKRLGMIESNNGNVSESLRYFNLWQYTNANYQKIDKYEYDFDILERIEQMAAPWHFDQANSAVDKGTGKVKLAYLLFGINQLNSVVVKINRILAKYHDKNRFEVTFFVPDAKSSVKVKSSKKSLQMIKSYNCDVQYSCAENDEFKRLLSTAENIYNYKPDILIVSVLLAEFQHYFIASMRPAPIIVGLVQGPPQQFVAPNLDWGISWSKHPLIDSPCDCTLVQLGLDMPEKSSIKPFSKKKLNIPDHSFILMSAGRHVKFQNQDFWKAVVDIIKSYTDVYYLVAGVTEDQIPFYKDILPNDISKRIVFLGWRTDILELFSIADLIIDTFPSGGGHVLVETMAMGIPFVSFENNYLNEFDQTDWSVADEFVSIPDLILTRGDFKQFKITVKQLIEDERYRTHMGELCKKQTLDLMGSPETSTRSYEDVLLKIIEKHYKKKGCASNTADEVNLDEKKKSNHRSLLSRLKYILKFKSSKV